MFIVVYSATVFVAAFLLFWIQPLAAKLLLPALGGSPAVWNTSVAFFQTVLLGGYGYAHLTARWLSPRRQAILHWFLLAAACSRLPIGFPTGNGRRSPPSSASSGPSSRKSVIAHRG